MNALRGDEARAARLPQVTCMPNGAAGQRVGWGPQCTGTVLSWRDGQRSERVPSSLWTRMSNSCSLRSQRDALRWTSRRLVVGGRVTVGRAVAEQCEDASQQFVGGGDDGALVAALAGQTLVMRLELALVGARGGVGALDEHGAQRAVAAPDAPGAAFAGAFVVAGTQAGPGREAMGVAEDGVRVGSGLAQDGAGCGVVLRISCPSGRSREA